MIPFTVNCYGHLEVGGIDTIDLVKKYDTPLYVYDVKCIRENCRAFVDTFRKLNVKSQVAYASKAFSSIAILQVIKQEGLSLDVVSEGELYTALQAGFPTEKIHLHGNNKSTSELKMAIENDVGCIVIDNFYEIELLNKLLPQYHKKIDVLIRVTPGIKANTHQYISTGNEDSKFGFDIQNGQAEKAMLLLREHEFIRLRGVHCHIGSQIFETNRFTQTTNILFKMIAEWKDTYGFTLEVLNLGGGFGIRYTENDHPLPLNEYVEVLSSAVKDHINKLNMPMPEIWIEPGRSIVGNAGLTLYTTGAMKQIPGVRNYVSVDGGMTDNIRPALYGAKYDGVIANKANQDNTMIVSIAGKCCESGDMLIWDLPTPTVEPGDILATFSTGAYGYSMASNYNRFTKPSVVFVENGKDQQVVKRETFQDITRYDISYE